MTNTNSTPAHTTQTAEAQAFSYKICLLEHTSGFTFDGRTFVTRVDLCDGSRKRLEFNSIRNAERFARAYAEARGLKYLEIGDMSEPALGETFVEIACA